MQPTDDLSTSEHIQPMDSRKQVKDLFNKKFEICFCFFCNNYFRKKL
jgi:hypothetical protein